jgi:hypothetical protein
MNWEMERLCWQIDEKRGDGQLGYNKKNLDLNSNLVM